MAPPRGRGRGKGKGKRKAKSEWELEATPAVDDQPNGEQPTNGRHCPQGLQLHRGHCTATQRTMRVCIRNLLIMHAGALVPACVHSTEEPQKPKKRITQEQWERQRRRKRR